MVQKEIIVKQKRMEQKWKSDHMILALSEVEYGNGFLNSAMKKANSAMNKAREAKDTTVGITKTMRDKARDAKDTTVGIATSKGEQG